MKNVLRLILWVCSVGFVVPGMADVVPHSLFTDSLVLQRGISIPVWGWADEGEKVKVTLNNTSRTAVTENGKWKIELPRMREGGPYVMTLEGDNTVEIHNVMIGDVWVCSGQSNMQWPMTRIFDAENEIANADYPKIRLYYVPRIATGGRQSTVDAVWEECSPKSVENFSAVAYFFGRHLHQELGVPIGLIHTSWGGTPAESWTTMETLENDPDYEPILERYAESVAKYHRDLEAVEDEYTEWKSKAEYAESKGDLVPTPPEIKLPSDPRRGGWRPSGLFSAMINPLIPYGIKGAIWYQGESNAGRAYQYRKLFADMITDWRREWGQGDFPFFFVQLASFCARRNPLPEIVWKSPWAELREAQTMALELKNTGMAVAIDIGEAFDIHPRNKQDVGKRLALSALKVAYGQDIVHSGPLYRSMEKKDGGIEVRFDSVGDGLRTRNDLPPSHFWIAGEDQVFYPAHAVITGKSTLRVSSPDVDDPVAVRYAWEDCPTPNLYNSADLPASPFRTDLWKGETEGNL